MPLLALPSSGNARRVVDGVRMEMEEALLKLRAYGQGRVAHVLESVLHASAMRCRRSNIWAVCALTGRPAHKNPEYGIVELYSQKSWGT